MFDVTVFGTNAVTYQWRRGGMDIAGQTKVILAISNAQTGDFAQYSVAVSSVGTTVISSNAALTMLPPKPVVSIVRAETNVLISWAAAYSGFALEESSNLAPNSWVPSSQSTSTNEDMVVLSVPVAVKAFYRLRKP